MFILNIKKLSYFNLKLKDLSKIKKFHFNKIVFNHEDNVKYYY